MPLVGIGILGGFRLDARLLKNLSRLLLASARDLAPVVGVVLVFQLAILQQAPDNVIQILIGVAFVLVGLTLFVQGLEMGLFPIGESMALALTKKGSLTALVGFAFALGFGTTVAEPALIAVSGEAARTAAEAGIVAADAPSQSRYADLPRLTVAISVGSALVLGVFRILKGWPIHWLIIGGYVFVLSLTAIAPAEIVGIAYDSGGVTTSTITVPLVTALGVGLASAISGRNPMIDGFGLIALASLTPMIFVLIFGMAWAAIP
jgi:hypothetical protein